MPGDATLRYVLFARPSDHQALRFQSKMTAGVVCAQSAPCRVCRPLSPILLLPGKPGRTTLTVIIINRKSDRKYEYGATHIRS